MVYLKFAYASSMGCSKKYVSLCQTHFSGGNHLGTIAWPDSSKANCVRWHVDYYKQSKQVTKNVTILPGEKKWVNNATILPGEKKLVDNDHKLPDNA